MVRDGQGKPVHAYARERRVQLDYSEYPQLLVRSFLAAEDKTFFSHGGIDYPGIASAIVTNLTSSGRPIGASTIPPQDETHLLLTHDPHSHRQVPARPLPTPIDTEQTKKTNI